MMRAFWLILILAIGGAIKIPAEQNLARQSPVWAALSLGEQFREGALLASLSGLRALVANVLYIEAHVAWEQTQWARMLLLFRQVTALQPGVVLFWDTAAWHMAWNASAAVMNDSREPRVALRVRRQREFIEIGRQFFVRGIELNPNQPQLHEALARLYRDKLHDHKGASDSFARAAALPGAAAYDERFSAYELSYCEGMEADAYQRLRQLYQRGERERLPTLLARIHALEEKLGVPNADRVVR